MCGYEGLCAMKCCLGLERSIPPVGLDVGHCISHNLFQSMLFVKMSLNMLY